MRTQGGMMESRGRLRVASVFLFIMFGVGDVKAQQGGHGVHPPMPTQELSFYCEWQSGDEVRKVESPIRIDSPLRAGPLDQPVALEGSAAIFRLTRYLPYSSLEQTVADDPSGAASPAIQLAVVGPSQSFRRWLVVGDPERNRLTSFIATWRLMAVEDRAPRDELLRQFESELTRDPEIVIRKAGATEARRLSARPGAFLTWEEADCMVRVEEFFPDYAVDRESKKPVNRSAKRLNPAAHVRIKAQGRSEDRWVFAKFPEFAAHREHELPYELQLDCGMETSRATPDFAVVLRGGKNLEVWTRHEGKAVSVEGEIGREIRIPNCQYHFAIERVVPSARIREEYVPTERGRGAPALEVEIMGPDDRPARVWLEQGKARTIRTRIGPATVVFAPKDSSVPGVRP